MFAYFCQRKQRNKIDYLQQWGEMGSTRQGKDDHLLNMPFCIVLTFGSMLMFYILQKAKLNSQEWGNEMKLNANRNKWIQVYFELITQPHWREKINPK